jgi:hypothetical protein
LSKFVCLLATIMTFVMRRSNKVAIFFASNFFYFYFSEKFPVFCFPSILKCLSFSLGQKMPDGAKLWRLFPLVTVSISKKEGIFIVMLKQYSSTNSVENIFIYLIYCQLIALISCDCIVFINLPLIRCFWFDKMEPRMMNKLITFPKGI